MILTYTIALVASWQRDKITTRNGRLRTHRPKKSEDAQDAHTLAMRAALSRSGLTWNIDGRFVVTVVYHPKDNRARDADRVLSLVLDAGTGVLWRDDSDRFLVSVRCDRTDWDGRSSLVRTGIVVDPGHTLVIVERVGDAEPRLVRDAVWREIEAFEKKRQRVSR